VKQQQTQTIQARARMSATKIHGPNSPDVISGRVPEGYREDVQCEGPKMIEVDYDQAVFLWGKETADELFNVNGRSSDA
jgi:hypothetical protein